MGVVQRGYRMCVMLINPSIEATPLVLHGLVPRLDMKGVARSARAHASTDPAAGMRRLSVRQVKSIVQFSASRCEAAISQLREVYNAVAMYRTLPYLNADDSIPDEHSVL